MNQQDVKTLAEKAAQSVQAAFFAAKDAGVSATLADLGEDLDRVITKLNQADIESRTEEFEDATKAVSQVFVNVKKLDDQVAKLVLVETGAKDALKDLFTFSQCVSFFKIPAPPL